MDDILKAPMWQKVLAVVVIAAAAFWLFNGNLIAPKQAEIKRLRDTLSSMDIEIRSIAPADIVVKNGPEVRELVRKQLEELMKKIPTEQEVPLIIDELISQVGMGLSIDYKLIEPKPLIREDKYFKLPLKLNFISDYSDLNLYLKQLKKLPATVRIDTFSLNRTDMTPKLKVDMQLSAFVMPGSPLVKEEKPPTQTMPYLFDPFFRYIEMRQGDKEKGKVPLVFTGVWMGREKKAFINDRELGIGESLLGYKLIQIGKDFVILLKEGNRVTLKLGGGK